MNLVQGTIPICIIILLIGMIGQCQDNQKREDLDRNLSELEDLITREKQKVDISADEDIYKSKTVDGDVE
jgi:hypothetical protein